MSKLRKTKNNKLILVLPMVLVISFVVLLTYSFANFKSIKLFDAVGGFFLGNEYTLSYDVANCTNKTIKNGKTFGELCVPATPDGYTFDGWYYNDELIEATTQVHTNQNVQLHAQFGAVGRCYIGKTYDFDYNGTNGTDGSIQEFIAHCPGNYKLETWGAQGGNVPSNKRGGFGSYSTGTVFLNDGDKLYIGVGGQGTTCTECNNALGGYNGGGDGYEATLRTGTTFSGGGGATHMVLNNNRGELKQYSSHRDEVLIVSGGGAGNWIYPKYNANYYTIDFGDAGGYVSKNTTSFNSDNNKTYTSNGATQSTGYAFGLGATDDEQAGGGGGGWYGGNANYLIATGGSGYIGNTNMNDKHMTCYNCTTNNNVDTKTISNTCHNTNPTVDCSKEGNGYARITYLGNITEFAYTGNYQEFIAPLSGNYQVELWGAEGGTITKTGLGGYTSGDIYLSKNDKLYFYIGQMATSSYNANAFNGGGKSTSSSYATQGGGGATDVRYFGNVTPSDSDLVWNSALGLNSRIMVAGGGGGTSHGGSGGPGGGLIGEHGIPSSNSNLSYGSGGTQTAGGAAGRFSWSGNGPSAGSFGIGGNGVSTYGGGGGGGYYGGGGSGVFQSSCGGGAGGSSYISGHAGSIAIAEGATNNPRTIKTGCSASSTDVECSKHYSGLYFTDTVMIDGSGYNWTTTKGSLVNQPQPDGTTATGHSGNGNARITYLGVPVTVTFNALDGNVSESSRSVIKNNQIGTLPIPTNGDYAFNGWYLDNEYTNEVSSSYVVTENITLYAKWDLNKLYLYRNGNISTLVGSFKRIEGHGYSYEMNPSVTYADSYIRINSGAGNTNNYSVALVSNNLINTTGYNKLCVTASHNGSGCNFNNGYYAYGISTGNSSISSGYVGHLNGMVVSGERTPCVDISNYNSSYYLAIGNSYSGYSDFSEVWLEK